MTSAHAKAGPSSLFVGVSPLLSARRGRIRYSRPQAGPGDIETSKSSILTFEDVQRGANLSQCVSLRPSRPGFF
jgi:hypothetical protein